MMTAEQRSQWLSTDKEICNKILSKDSCDKRHQALFSCSKCDYVSVTPKDVENHGKWYGPHKNTDLQRILLEQPTHMYGKMTTVDVENLLEETASLQVPNTVTMEHTENTGIVAPESITEVPPFEDILPDLLGVGESGEIDK